jgi:glucose-6-phosphate-specific signal transduction histidine kinase
MLGGYFRANKSSVVVVTTLSVEPNIIISKFKRKKYWQTLLFNVLLPTQCHDLLYPGVIGFVPLSVHAIAFIFSA